MGYALHLGKRGKENREKEDKEGKLSKGIGGGAEKEIRSVGLGVGLE